MSNFSYFTPIDSVAAQIFERQLAVPDLTTGGEPYLYADAAGSLIWKTSDGSANGYVCITHGPYALKATDSKLGVNVAGPITITLLDTYPEGEILTIWDAGGNAGAPGQAITIIPSPLQQINSLGKGVSTALTTNHARASLIRTGNRWNWIATP